MIGRLQGKLLLNKPPELILDVHGVGYEIAAPMSTFYQLPGLGQEVVLHTHLVVREDGHYLFGFASLDERKLFRALIKVNGVGPKLALTILSSLEPEAFVQCVQFNDVNQLVKVPGIGKKTAERLIIEMADRLQDWESAPTAAFTAGGVASSDFMRQDAIEALIALGYKAGDAGKMVRKVNQEVNTREELIRMALQGLAEA